MGISIGEDDIEDSVDDVIEFVGGFPTTNWCKISFELFDDVACE